jgi:hypothetical protein
MLINGFEYSWLFLISHLKMRVALIMQVMKIYLSGPPCLLSTPPLLEFFWVCQTFNLLYAPLVSAFSLFHQIWQMILNLNIRPLTHLLGCN